MKDYSDDFYRHRDATTRHSAERIVPLVLDLVPARSVVDVGCGVGTWLSIFLRHGVPEVRGYEGTWLDPSRLVVAREFVTQGDLQVPINAGRRFDLAMSLELAEHLPAACAPGFVESLTRLAPAVLFSAAIPGQGGTHHVNEQWPRYWIDLFAPHGFLAIDCIRAAVWQDEQVLWWYAQNTFLMVHRDLLESTPSLRRAREQAPTMPLNLVHPGHLLSKCAAMTRLREEVPSLRRSFQSLGASLKRAVIQRVPGFHSRP
ncbi:MAG TPA: methyltransferase domain-containing protein [Dongiaceae bacterium]|nr:methyltransferase domain-containing protein [Dongiaceae bacterium]